MNRTDAAPWSVSLKTISAFASLIMAGVITTALLFLPPGATLPIITLIVIPFSILAGSLLFMIRGYEIRSGDLYILRPLWKNRVPLRSLTSAAVASGITRKSLRLFGNGGLFSFSGWFRNRELGIYRQYVTNHNNTLVLRFSDRKPLVISPADPVDVSRRILELNNLSHKS